MQQTTLRKILVSSFWIYLPPNVDKCGGGVLSLARGGTGISTATGTTGTGNIVLSAGPTFTGTVTASNISTALLNGFMTPKILTGTAGGAATGTITFSQAFSTPPVVVGNYNTSAAGYMFVVHISNVTTTSFTYYNAVLTGGTIYTGTSPTNTWSWIAVGL